LLYFQIVAKPPPPLIIAIPTLSAFAAIIGLWRERRAYELHSYEYSRMCELVEEGLRLEAVRLGDDPEVGRKVIYAVGCAALHEASRGFSPTAASRSIPFRREADVGKSAAIG
jgi:hypothetical protein